MRSAPISVSVPFIRLNSTPPPPGGLFVSLVVDSFLPHPPFPSLPSHLASETEGGRWRSPVPCSEFASLAKQSAAVGPANGLPREREGGGAPSLLLLHPHVVLCSAPLLRRSQLWRRTMAGEDGWAKTARPSEKRATSSPSPARPTRAVPGAVAPSDKMGGPRLAADSKVFVCVTIVPQSNTSWPWAFLDMCVGVFCILVICLPL